MNSAAPAGPETTSSDQEELFRSLFAFHDAVMLLIEPGTGRIVDANDAATAFYGYPRERLCSMRIGDLNQLPEQEIAAALNRAAGMECNSFEFPHRLAGGEIRTVEVHSSPVTLRDRRLLFSIIFDITRRKCAEEALRNSEVRLKEAQRIAAMGSWELDVPSDRLTWSDEIFRIFEIDPDRFEASYEAFLEAIHPEDRETVNAAYLASLDKQTPYAITHRLLMKDGRVKHVEERCETTFGPEGRPLVSRGTVQDISERRRAEEAIRESEARYRLLTQNLPQKVFVKDRGSVYVMCNDNFAADLGVSPDAIRGMTDFDFFPAGLAEKYCADDRRVMETGKTERIEERYSRGDSEIWVETVKTPIRDGEGRVTGILGIFQDISDRKRAADALAEAVAFREQVIQSAQDGIIVYDRDLRYRLWNPFMERMTGIRAEDVIGRNPAELFPFLEPTGVLDRLKRCLEGERGAPVEFPVQMPDGRRIWTTDASGPLRNHAGEIIGVIGIVRETTAQHEAEEALVRSERLAAVGKLASGVAHEFNNILAIVRIESQLLAMDPVLGDQPGVLQRLETIDEQTERGRQVAAGIMALARPVPPSLQLVGVSEMVDRVLAVQRTALAGENIEVQVAVPGDLQVKADSGKIQQVLLNLVLNARDAMKPMQGGRLVLAAGKSVATGEVRLSVTDSGVGMSREILDRLFTPFFTTKGGFATGDHGLKGNGLGLAVSYSIMQEHGGRIEVESVPGSGTTFTLCFPPVESAPGNAERPSS